MLIGSIEIWSRSLKAFLLFATEIPRPVLQWQKAEEVLLSLVRGQQVVKKKMLKIRHRSIKPNSHLFTSFFFLFVL